MLYTMQDCVINVCVHMYIYELSFWMMTYKAEIFEELPKLQLLG